MVALRGEVEVKELVVFVGSAARTTQAEAGGALADDQHGTKSSILGQVRKKQLHVQAGSVVLQAALLCCT